MTEMAPLATQSSKKEIVIQELEKIETNEGQLWPLYRDWDEWHHGYHPKMAYVTTIGPGQKKGPILHKERKYYITALSGNLVLTCFLHETFQHYPLCDEKGRSKIALIPEGVPIVLENFSKTDVATIINLPSKAWHPDNQDTYKFNSWAEYLEWDE